jgi:cytochrome c peroxidase
MSASKIARVIFVYILASFVSGQLVPCLAQSQPLASVRTAKRKVHRRNDTPETLLGERLFLETRFAQYFAAHSIGDVNRPLAQGDPVVAHVWNPRAAVSYPSPFGGKSRNCRSCHLINEFSSSMFIDGTNRAYCDFLQRSPIPYRGDGHIINTRNTRNLVDDFTPRHAGILLHGDGEFLTVDPLIKSSLTGRSFGWLLAEHDEAVSHVARVIREDDGRDALGQQYGGSYAKLMLGTASDLPDQFRLASDFRIDVTTATDRQIVDEVARLIAAFLKTCQFEHTAEGIHSGSAYDMFLAKNGLPAQPAQGETDAEYSHRLLQKLEQLQNPRFVLPYERWLRFHPHVREFGDQELAGLKIFLRQGAPSPQEFSAKRVSPSAERGPAASNSVSHAGNCFVCHAAPDFTDIRFHNTGAAQEEYDSLHGAGSFARLPVPSYAERSHYLDRYLPATPNHPHATGVFRSLPAMSNPSATDLGMWNIFANADFPGVQSEMRRLLCDTRPCDPNVQLPRTIALFRTPSLRDLGHSWPYLHTGRMAAVEDVLHFYIRMSALARAGQLRNGDPELTRISLDEQDVAALAAFLRSLDEDYNDD